MNVKFGGEVMSKQELLNELLKTNGEVLLTRQAEKAGLSRKLLSLAVQSGKLERVAHGVYISPDAFDDFMYRIQMKSPSAIYSHETALYMHDLCDRTPIIYSVTVPSDYNARHLKSESLQIFYIKRELHQMGVVDSKTFIGRIVRIYNVERTMCDMVRSRSRVDISLLMDSLKRYAWRKERNIRLLMNYAEAFNIELLMRQYMEVLL